MNKLMIIITLLTITVAATTHAAAVAPPIVVPEMQLIHNNIIVDLTVSNVTEFETSVKSGIGKEIVFTVELLRVWKFWPDEFVVSKKIVKVIRYDNLREQYQASIYDGIDRSKINFNDYASMKDWLFRVRGINLANIKELVPGSYYIRTMVESRSLEQLPFIGFLMHFIPEVEMSLAKESRPFIVGNNL